MPHVMKHGFPCPPHQWIGNSGHPMGCRPIYPMKGFLIACWKAWCFLLTCWQKEEWFVRNIFVDSGNPVLVLMERREEHHE